MKDIHTEGWNKFSDNQKPEFLRQILVNTGNINWPFEIQVFTGDNNYPYKWDLWKYLD